MARSEEQIVWNFPVDVSFSSTNAFGWPRIALSVYGIDFLGRDVIRGYGSALIPLSSGPHRIEIDMFAPLATSYLNDLMSWMMGNPPEVSFGLCSVANMIGLIEGIDLAVLRLQVCLSRGRP